MSYSKRRKSTVCVQCGKILVMLRSVFCSSVCSSRHFNAKYPRRQVIPAEYYREYRKRRMQ